MTHINTEKDALSVRIDQMQEYFNEKFTESAKETDDKFGKVMKQQEDSDTRRDQLFSEFKAILLDNISFSKNKPLDHKSLKFYSYFKTFEDKIFWINQTDPKSSD